MKVPLISVLTVIGVMLVFSGVRSQAGYSTATRSVPVNLPAGLLTRAAGPLEVSSINRLNDGTFAARARMWKVTSLLKGEVDDAGGLVALEILPMGRDATSDGWNVWRHRHGYVHVPGLGYRWLALDGTFEPFEADLGSLYDSFLKDIWRFWIVRSWGETTAYLRSATESSDNLKTLVNLRTNKTGEITASPVDLKIEPWNIPVKIRFSVRSSSGPASPVVATGPIEWTFDMNQWRLRHGYRRLFFGGYEWEAGFPERIEMTGELGMNLDLLLNRALSYWVDVSVEAVIDSINDVEGTVSWIS